MATNLIAYFPNPVKSSTVGSLVSAAAAGTTTVFTAASGSAPKVTSFTLTATIIGTPGTDYNDITITIGTAKFYYVFNSAAVPGTTVVVTSAQLGFNPSFLQVADTITINNAKTGTPGGNIGLSVTIDDYSA